ncbi:MAG: TRAP transporter substrate-binding protein [Burkholderiales bacterium]|jgi:TRAP-type C4-dicarboxylate transport system substrate-binding protein|nr:TRAP transporter substrate-binding protein [Burkholderiales bacterium]
MKKVTIGLAALALAASASAWAQQEVTLKVSHFLPAGSAAQQRFIQPWCDKIAKESNSRLKCQIFPSMQLGGTPPQLYDQVKDGVADIVWTLPGYTAGRFPAVEVFELPFTMTNAEGTSRALWEFVQANPAAKDAFKDVHPILFHVHGPGYLHTRDKQVKTLGDLKGMKVRAPTRLTNKLIASVGATPVGMPVPAVPEAISKGVIDGAVVPWEVVPAIKLQELVKFHSETDPSRPALYTSTFIFAMNKAKYDSLPADLKKVLDANSGPEASAWVGKMFMEADVAGRKLAVDRGNTIYMIPASELANWEKASSQVDDDWVKEVSGKGLDGAALLKSAKDLIAKNTK